MSHRTELNQLNVIVGDMAATVAFYRRLGLQFDGDDAHHVETRLANGLTIEFDTTSSVKHWDSGWKGTTGGNTVLGFALHSREEVDALYEELTGAGYRGRQRPYDAFWGARYAIVEDPDGNGVGLMSPIEADRKFWPPSQPPS